MAKRARPEPAITQKWEDILRPLVQKKTRRLKLVKEVEKEIEVAVQGACSEGVLVGPLKKVTGLSGSRIYQLKFAERDAAAAAS
jgi:hypothetical protein